MRKKIWRDCTGEPPGELITSATALAFLVANARSSVRAMPASDIPGRSGVTAPITPDSRTTGTTAVPRRRRSGRYAVSLSIRPESPRGSLVWSVISLPRVNYSLSRKCHWKCGTPFALPCFTRLQRRSGEKHENLFADAADWRPPDRSPFHFRPRTAFENAAAVAFNGLCAQDLSVQGIASDKIPFPARISCSCLSGTADSLLSISAGKICNGALPPLVARTSIRIEGEVGSP